MGSPDLSVDKVEGEFSTRVHTECDVLATCNRCKTVFKT
jgi:hypothetical protein